MIRTTLKAVLSGKQVDRLRIIKDNMEQWLDRHFDSSQVTWPHHVIFIAGLPKSGTTWLAQLLDEVPGYRFRWPHDPDKCIFNHDVCDAAFASLPWDLYSVVKLHTRYSQTNMESIEKYKLRTVVMYRDLRDHCVSRYFHILCDPSHRHHRLYKEVSEEEGLSHSIEITLEHYVPWVEGWLPLIARYPDRFLEVRYENLRVASVQVLTRVLEFYDIQLPKEQIAEIVEEIAARTKFDLPANLSRGNGTARRGVVGGWRDHFTEQHMQRFKEDCGRLLIELGYEKNMDWTD
jgi:hypothetical protein